MLTAIRTASSKWLGRLVLTVIMGMLIISFAIWGIGDIFRGGVNRTVAQVGSAKISADAFRTSFNEELRRIQQRLRRAVTTDDARSFGLDRDLLNRMIDEAALNQKAAQLGLTLDTPAISASILTADMFKVGGEFNRNRFADILQQNGLTEVQFVRQQGELLLRQQIANGITGNFTTPDVLGRAVHLYREQERTLSVIVLPPEKAAEPAAPDEAALKAFHEERKSEFRTIETRKVTLLATSSVQFASGITVSEADARAFYEAQLAGGRFGSPERRRALRILFDTEAEARAAKAKLDGGTAIAALLADKKLAESDVDLGMKAARELADPAVRSAVFALETGKTSEPVKDAFGFVLLHLAAIEPAKATPFAEVQTQLMGEARMDKISKDPAVKRQLDDLFKKVEDQRIGGKSLAEAATFAGLTPVVIDAITRQGDDANGNRISLAGGQETLTALFASDIGLDNEPQQQRDGGHVWFEVNAVDAARDKAYDEVKDEVKLRLIADLKSKSLAETASSLLKKLEAGEKLDALAASLSLGVQNFTAIKRSSREAVLGQAGVERAFSGPVGTAISAVAPDGIGRLIILPTASSALPYDANADKLSGFSKQMAQSYSDDLIAQYVAGVRKELGVAINQNILQQALGTAQP